MNSKLTKLALTATLGLAITFTLNACEEKKKPASEPEAAKAAEVVKGTFTDTRDNKTYKTVKMGEQVWFAENLNYNAKGSKCGGTDLKSGDGEGEEWYLLENKNTANCDKYGRLYNFETAMKACPSGWHLPTNEEWDKLYHFADGTFDKDNSSRSETAGKFLKATSGWERDGNGEDNYGFAALPGGYGTSDGHFTTEVGYAGNWWSYIDGMDGNYFIGVRTIDTDPGAYGSGNFDGSEFLSVRCLQGDAKEAEAKVAAAKAAERAEQAVEEAMEAALAKVAAATKAVKAEEIVKDTFTDTRDSKTYKTVKIGEQVWMAENLNYNASGSKCYENKSANCDIYGKLYNWDMAKTACPKGWHLPSNAEWEVLMVAVGGYKTADKYLKSTSGWNDLEGKSSGNGTNDYGFSALPGGRFYDGSFNSIGNYGDWYSSSEGYADRAYSRNMGYGNDGVYSYSLYKSFWFSVRCLQDSP